MLVVVTSYSENETFEFQIKKAPDDWDGKNYETLSFCVGSNQFVNPADAWWSSAHNGKLSIREVDGHGFFCRYVYTGCASDSPAVLIVHGVYFEHWRRSPELTALADECYGFLSDSDSKESNLFWCAKDEDIMAYFRNERGDTR